MTSYSKSHPPTYSNQDPLPNHTTSLQKPRNSKVSIMYKTTKPSNINLQLKPNAIQPTRTTKSLQQPTTKPNVKQVRLQTSSMQQQPPHIYFYISNETNHIHVRTASSDPCLTPINHTSIRPLAPPTSTCTPAQNIFNGCQKDCTRASQQTPATATPPSMQRLRSR